jgi:hypothetical protein
MGERKRGGGKRRGITAVPRIPACRRPCQLQKDNMNLAMNFIRHINMAVHKERELPGVGCRTPQFNLQPHQIHIFYELGGRF